MTTQTTTTDGHFEAYLVCEGALDEERTFNDEAEAEAWCLGQVKACARDGVEAQAYIVPHYGDHTGADGCVCAQYMADHSPVASTEDLEA